MTAQSLRVTPWVIPEPDRNGDNPVQLNETLGIWFNSSPDNIRTLSTTGANPGDQTGLLYVPDLPDGDECFNASQPYVPTNVTRVANLPPNLRLLAIAPWTSGDCALKYMEDARMHVTQGMIFFIPGTGNTPPDATAPQWVISSSRRWKSDNRFPVYGISGDDGLTLMNRSEQYSKNLSDVPNGDELAKLYPTTDYVRLYADVNTGSGSNLPSLWVFLLVVLGILLTIIGITSLSMHFIQRRRRNSLRRRVANGEVDLEALGIKRLTVPQELLNKMPLYIYGTMGRKAGTDSDSLSKEAMAEERTARTPATTTDSIGYHPTPLSQPTCPICLDDFEVASADSEGTMVRELPCHHIFHAECVDIFLRDNSSLCPMCKETALPKGYCPSQITNAMVRRERMVRLMQRRAARDPENVEMPNLDGHTSASGMTRMRMRMNLMRGQRSTPATDPASSTQEMNNMPSVDTISPPAPAVAAPPSAPAVHPPAQPLSSTSRQEWARQRALSMVGRNHAPVDPDAEEARRTPGWKRALRTIFPFGR